jgi:hypothetical protein
MADILSDLTEKCNPYPATINSELLMCHNFSAIFVGPLIFEGLPYPFSLLENAYFMA